MNEPLITRPLELRASAAASDVQKNIAERQQREKAALLACIAEGVYAIDGDGYCSFASPCAAAMLGYTQAELLGSDIHALIHPESGANGSVVHDCQLLRATGIARQVRTEDVFQRNDGSSFPVTISAAPLSYGDELTGTVVTFADINERKIEQERSIQSEARLRKHSRVLLQMTKCTDAPAGLDSALRFMIAADSDTLEARGVGVWTFNHDHTNVSCVLHYDRDSNRYSSGQTIASSDYPVYFRALAEARAIAASDAATDPRTRELADTYLTPNAITSMLDVPLRLGNDLIGIICHEHVGPSREWTPDEQSFAASVGDMVGATFASLERRRAEEELRASHALLNGIIEGTADAVSVKDVDGRYVMINTPGAVMLNRPATEVIGKSDAELFAPAVASEFAEDDRKTLLGGGPRTHEEAAMVGQTKRFWLTTKTIYRGNAGEVRGVIGVTRDITEQRALEEQVRQSQKIEAIGRFAGGIAHDFNNLLAIIKSYSDFLLRGLDTSDERRADVQEIRDAADRAAALTRQLLVFSQRQPLRSHVFDLNHLIDGLQAVLRRLLPEHVEFRTSLDPRLGCVRADQAQLEKVILNLVVNARDAMPDGGLLHVSTENADLDATSVRAYPGMPAGRFVLLTLRDTGVGMDAETQSHVFEPFFTTKDIGRGTGLAMSMVYGFLKASAGHIFVDSATGAGTTIRVFLPRQEEETQYSAVGGDARPSEASKYAILIVEDESFVRNAMVAILEEEGYRVLQAGDGAAALRISGETSKPIDVLVSEVLLPGLTGRQMAEEIVAKSPHTQVVYVSAFSEKALARRKLIPAGAPLVSKPFTREDLLGTVSRILASRPSR